MALQLSASFTTVLVHLCSATKRPAAAEVADMKPRSEYCVSCVTVDFARTKNYGLEGATFLGALAANVE
uniref:Putative secreted protein n=1 Tax=Anopheles marajoara TaxID=58244 RepID=A0A2M4CFX9_9DIPT